MGRPNYRHTDKPEKKGSAFFGNIKSLFVGKEQEVSGEDNTSLSRPKYEEMEDGFIKTKPRDYFSAPYDDEDTSSDSSLSFGAPQNTSTSFSSSSSYASSSINNGGVSSAVSTDDSAKKGITLSGSALFTALVTIVILIGFAFLFGLIIGKGSSPQVEKESPKKLEARVQEAEKPVNVLPKEQLQFMTELKKEQVRKTPEEIKAEEEALKKAEAEKKAKEAKALEEKKKAEADKKKAEQKLANANKKYDFDIRVAAFRNEDQANKLRIKLETDGFRTKRTVKSDSKGNWYYIHVLLIGTEERLRESQERFRKFGVGDTIIESKTELK